MYGTYCYETVVDHAGDVKHPSPPRAHARLQKPVSNMELSHVLGDLFRLQILKQLYVS